MAFLYEQIANMNDVPTALLDSISAAQTQPAELEGFGTPTLVISGDKDVLFPPDALRQGTEARRIHRKSIGKYAFFAQFFG